MRRSYASFPAVTSSIVEEWEHLRGGGRDRTSVPTTASRALGVSLPDELLLIAVVDQPADLAAGPFVGVHVHVSVAGTNCLDELFERPGFDAPVGDQYISGSDHARDGALRRRARRFASAPAEERNDAPVDGALSEMDVGRARGRALERCVTELVSDEAILVVDARGEAPFAGRRDRTDLLVPVQIGGDTSWPARTSLGHGVGGRTQSKNYRHEPCELHLLVHVVSFSVTEIRNLAYGLRSTRWPTLGTPRSFTTKSMYTPGTACAW